MYVFVFFFFKQKTAYEMRISDWSSDVCSSDLNGSRRAREHVSHGALPSSARATKMLPPCGSALAASRTGTVARMSPDCASDDGAAAIRMSVERVTNSGAARQAGGGGGAWPGGDIPDGTTPPGAEAGRQA